MLATHSTIPRRVAAAPPATTAPSAPPSAAAPPVAAAPPAAQQHAKTQLRTITPPKIPQTAGFAVWGAQIAGTATGGCIACSGGWGTLGRAAATSSAGLR